jgi:hypothetical protein
MLLAALQANKTQRFQTFNRSGYFPTGPQQRPWQQTKHEVQNPYVSRYDSGEHAGRSRVCPCRRIHGVTHPLTHGFITITGTLFLTCCP